MRYGISNLSIVPVRSEPNERSEMCTQILFREHYTIVEESARWCLVKLAFDGFEGWIDLKMINEVNEKHFLQLADIPPFVTTEVTNVVQSNGGSCSFLILAGSSLPHFNKTTRSFKIGGDKYKIKRNIIPSDEHDIREALIENAYNYYNAPYLWGGRSPFGIDCSGFTQILYKMAGLTIPRESTQQAAIGDNLTFVEEALPGDLAFFDNEEGTIIHCGVILENNKIIHSSGKVRIDNLDHFGIFNVEKGRYTHQMRLMRRLIKE